MARTVKTSITLSPEAHHIGVILAKTDRMANGSEATLSSIINNLLLEQSSEPIKEKKIVPVFEMIGKRKKLIGFDAWYGDDLIDTRDTRAAAQQALDAYVYEELSK